MTALRKDAAPKKKRKKFVKPGTSVIIFPKLLERKYEERVADLFNEVSLIIRRLVIPALPTLAGEYDKAMRADSQAALRMDDFTGGLHNVIGGIVVQIGEKVGLFKSTIKNIGDETNVWNREQQARVIKERIGINILANDRDMDAAIDIWVRENVRSIASLASNETKRVEQTLIDGFRNGLRHEEIAKGILDTFKSAADRVTNQVGGMSIENKARLLARDQLGKLNAQITRTRQTRLGINRYRWRTSKDERVRQSHKDLEGQVFYWNAADGDVPDVGHPGVDYNCRCWAEPMLDDVLSSDSD